MTTATGNRPAVNLPHRPRFRGRIHQVAFIVSIPLGLVLVAVGPTVQSRWTSAVYALTMAAMYGVSASYHRYPWSPGALRRMQRLDHSMIFLLIAGTYTPLSSLALEGGLRIAILAVVWGGAALGIGLRFLRADGVPALSGVLYITLGWAAIVAMPQFIRALPIASTALILIGGVLYTGGAAVLMRRRPDPSPSVFGYHEIWHACVVGGGLAHYLAVLVLLLSR
jgi:hemolysin III